MITCDPTDLISTNSYFISDDSTATCQSSNKIYLDTYTITRIAEEKPTEDEKAEAVKAEAEAKRIRHMRELWKLERKFNRNRNGMRQIK
jgi:hypothetical protein